MKTRLLVVLIFIIFGLISCQKDESLKEYIIEAQVLGINSDCGIYAVKILEGLSQVISIVGPTVGDSIYIAKNLPKDMEIQGLNILIDIRSPKVEEITACTDRGPTYNWLYIKTAKRK